MAVAKSKKLIKAEARYEKVSRVLQSKRLVLEKERAKLEKVRVKLEKETYRLNAAAQKVAEKISALSLQLDDAGDAFEIVRYEAERKSA